MNPLLCREQKQENKNQPLYSKLAFERKGSLCSWEQIQGQLCCFRMVQTSSRWTWDMVDYCGLLPNTKQMRQQPAQEPRWSYLMLGEHLSIRCTHPVFTLSWVVAFNNGFTRDTGLQDVRFGGFGNAYTEVEQFNNTDFLSTLNFLHRTVKHLRSTKEYRISEPRIYLACHSGILKLKLFKQPLQGTQSWGSSTRLPWMLLFQVRIWKVLRVTKSTDKTLLFRSGEGKAVWLCSF